MIIIIILFILNKLVLCEFNNCFKSDLTLTQKLEYNGFHRQIHWLLEVDKHTIKQFEQSSCRIMLKLLIPEEMYMNPDEISELNHMNLSNIFVYIEGKVNVESVAHLSKPHNAYIYLPKTIKEKQSLTIPIHLRYQRPQISGDYGKTTLYKPSILVNCVDNHVCVKNSKVTIFCEYGDKENCIWKNITYKALFDHIEIIVPIGNLDHYPLVSIVTLLLGCAGCIYILSLLSTAPL